MSNVAEIAPAISAGKRQAKETALETERARMVSWLAERVATAGQSGEPVIEVVTLTPVLADILLNRNADNRSLSDTIVDRIKRDIVAGHWVFNGETVVVSRDGKLNDGQHRCAAVVAAGRGIPVIMVIGPTRESRMTLDMGIPRTVGHFLAMKGYTDTNNLAAVAGLIWQWKERGKVSAAGKERPTKYEVQMVVEHYRDIPESLHTVSVAGAASICSKSILAFAHWAIWKTAGRHDADKFIRSLIDGEALERGSPILYCRNRLIEMRALHGAGGVNARAEMIFRAWNSYRTRENVTRIPIRGSLPALEV